MPRRHRPIPCSAFEAHKERDPQRIIRHGWVRRLRPSELTTLYINGRKCMDFP